MNKLAIDLSIVLLYNNIYSVIHINFLYKHLTILGDGMSFQNQTAEETKDRKSNDGHWSLRYFGKNGVLRRDRRAYNVKRKWFFGLRAVQNSYSLDEVQEQFVRKDLEYASTLYSARFILGTQILLAKVIDEIEPFFVNVTLSASEKEVMMAIYEHLTFFGCSFLGDREKHHGKAFVLSQEVLKEHDKGTVTLSTFLLVHARLSKLCQVRRSDQGYYRSYVKVECSKLISTPSTLEQNLDQGWKTIARLGGLIGDWGMVDVALSHDSSRSIHVKSWMCPGYIWYKIKKIFT